MSNKFAGAYIEPEKHEALVRLAKQNHRTLADQCRKLFDDAIKGELEVPDQPKEEDAEQ